MAQDKSLICFSEESTIPIIVSELFCRELLNGLKREQEVFANIFIKGKRIHIA